MDAKDGCVSVCMLRFSVPVWILRMYLFEWILRVFVSVGILRKFFLHVYLDPYDVCLYGY